MLYKNDIEFEFGDPEMGISPDVDKKRREAAFKILCIVRFVRQGLSVPEPPSAAGPILPKEYI